MKALITIVVVLLVGIAALVLINGGSTARIKPFESRLHQGAPLDFYDLTLAGGLTYKDIIGLDVSGQDGDWHGHIEFYNGTWRGYVTGRLSDGLFDSLRDIIHLKAEPRLLEIWPSAFDCKDGPFKQEFWNPSWLSDGQLFYYEHPETDTRLAVSYKSGAFYYIRETHYVSAGKNIDGIDLFEKAKRTD